VGAPKSQLKHFEQQLLETTSWTEVQNGLEARLVKHPDGGPDEQYVLCRSTDRAKKELAMLANQCGRLTGELAKINAALRKKPTEDIESVSRRIGRWLGKYPAAAKVIEATLQRDAEGRAIALQITSNIAKGRELFRRHGAYLLRTNCDEQDPAQIWRWYVQLTQAEAAFRTAKSDLNLRPIYHQLGRRVEAHILVCFLALAQRRVLEQWMESRGLGTCAGKFIEEISAIKSMDVILPVKRGEQVAELRIRTVARPESRVAELLLRLGLELPERNRILETSPPRPPYKTLGEAAAEAAKSQAESMAAKM
jgi:transposase